MRFDRKASILIGLSMLTAFIAVGPIHSVSGDVTWSGPTPLFLDSSPPYAHDSLPSTLQASNGQLWVAWQSNRASQTNRFDILYKTMNGGGIWSPTVNFTSAYDNGGPSLVQLGNGTILLFWSSNPTGSYRIYYASYNGASWSASIPITTGGNDVVPSAAVARNGTLWLAWTRITPSCTIVPCRQIWYKTLGNGGWSSEVQLTTDATWNVNSSVLTAKDGRVWVFFAKYQIPGKNFQIWYKLYNGVGWTPDTQFTAKSVWDERPSGVQDRNGTLWVFWDRQVPINTTLDAGDIFSNFSKDNGVTWAGETQMTFDPPGVKGIDDAQPSAVQGADKTLWVFFSSDLTGNGLDYDIYYLHSSPIYPVHDVDVSSIQSSPGKLYPGGLKSVGQSSLVKVNVTVVDVGDFAESVQVQLNAVNSTSYAVGTGSGSVPLGGSVIVSFVWNTTSIIKPGRYGFQASVVPVPGESIGNGSDNSFLVKNLVHLIPLGDIDQDGRVDVLDASVMAYDYGAMIGSPRYNPYADIGNFGVINVLDASVLAANYGIST